MESNAAVTLQFEDLAVDFFFICVFGVEKSIKQLLLIDVKSVF